MTPFFVQIKCELGKAYQVANELAEAEIASEIYSTAGNFDLLVKNERRQTLLIWRHDQYYRGWHVPGGIIRFKERIHERITAVATAEFGASVSFDPAPIAMHEKFAPSRNIRGHFISLLYQCQLLSEPNQELRCKNPLNPDSAQWMWHDRSPTDLIHQHDSYRKFIDP
jgi:colanic acid biosynthesis protein WcaH